MIEEEDRAIHIKKIVKHEKAVKQAIDSHENRIRLEKVQLKDEFVAAFQKTRSVEKRVPLIICSKQYFRGSYENIGLQSLKLILFL